MHFFDLKGDWTTYQLNRHNIYPVSLDKMASKYIEGEFILTIPDDYDDDESSSEQSEEVAEEPSRGQKRKADELNSDFEFDLPENNFADVIDNDFDGWGKSATNVGSKEQLKTNVDIHDIVGSRAASKSIANGDKVTNGGSDSRDPNTFEEKEEASDADFPDFENDELLATDGFGAYAENEIEEDDDMSNSQDHDTNEDDSNASEVASPVPHPDDQRSEDSDSEAESVEDQQEIAKRAAFFAPGATVSEASNLTKTGASAFTSFSLSRPILRALTSLAFSTPTPIQVRTIPVAMEGHDVVGSAVTGSGKTAAFLLPILERLLYRPNRIATTRVTILVPTRELAVQCHAVAVQLAKYTDITFALIVGGFSLREQESLLKKRPDIVIATPGRFIDHMRNSASFAVDSIEILVLDEADRMLDDGFADELDEILKTLPKNRQTMLFSATMTNSIDRLVHLGMKRPVRVNVDKRKATTIGLVQEFIRLRRGREAFRLATLAQLCTETYRERTIVFFPQKKQAHRILVVFALLGIRAGELHGDMTQDQRLRSVESFRSGLTTHLLATDVASRGLDIRNVATVINFEAPHSHEIYVHRVGRTARAGKEGRAVTIAAESDRNVVKAAVKTARAQGARVVSRAMDPTEIDAMHARIDALEDEIEAVLKEEKEQKALAQLSRDLTRGENMVTHQTEILSRPKRTWFESEKDKLAAKMKNRPVAVVASGASMKNDSGSFGRGGKAGGGGGKLSNKQKKRLDKNRDFKEAGGAGGVNRVAKSLKQGGHRAGRVASKGSKKAKRK